MSSSRIKTIQTDFFATLQGPANDFLSTTAGLVVEKIICDDFIILSNGNQAHNFTCQYHITGEDLQRQLVQLIMRDSVLDLKAAINAAITALVEEDNEILDIQRCDAILDNGNKFYCACLIYEPSEEPSIGLQVNIIEKDTVADLQTAVNVFLATAIDLNTIGVLRQEMILENGNRVYTCTIPYTIPG
ncbi:MAG: hypothetical protein V4721_16555 [Bacteroidota bacterium]